MLCSFVRGDALCTGKWEAVMAFRFWVMLTGLWCLLVGPVAVSFVLMGGSGFWNLMIVIAPPLALLVIGRAFIWAVRGA
jgi:hypothetical protein